MHFSVLKIFVSVTCQYVTQTKRNAAVQRVSVVLAEQLDKTLMHMMQVNNS